MSKKTDLLIAAFPDVAGIGKKVARTLGANFEIIQVHKFPDNEFNLKFKNNPKGKKVVVINSIFNETNQKLIETLLAGGIAKDYGARKTILVATYLPYMRQDTHFMNYDSFSAKHMLEVFADFDKVIAIDPHLHRIKKMHSLSSKAESITADDVIASYIKAHFKGNFEIIGPDEESQQWSEKIAKILKKKVVILHKDRLGDTKIKQDKVNFDENKNYIIIDDIISTGKTISGVLGMIKEKGAKRLTCIGIHGVLINGADKLIRKHANLITTNTIPNKYSKIDVSPAIIERLNKEI